MAIKLYEDCLFAGENKRIRVHSDTVAALNMIGQLKWQIGQGYDQYPTFCDWALFVDQHIPPFAWEFESVLP
jgi:hypothetical protein